LVGACEVLSGIEAGTSLCLLRLESRFEVYPRCAEGFMCV
jgi:hypothetical protein